MRDFSGSNDRLAQFRVQLLTEGFLGDIADDLGTRAVFSTDNSVYELPPLAVVFPRVPVDLDRIAHAAYAAGLPITARGGGTGTNGQSLTDAICVDCSRYLTEIEEINVAEGYAIVQPGVILDQLNRAARAHDLFFAPTVSTASRATLGGMAATDASGKGSRIYGRTSDHVLSMDVVLADGTPINTSTDNALSRAVKDTLVDEVADIARVFPTMNRGLTGYNLKDAAGGDLVKLLCGSEGTLALTKRLKLRLLPKPACRALVVFAYSDMMVALRDVRRLVKADPAAIEFIDDKILSLAQQDPVWDSISGVLGALDDGAVSGLNFVEVIGPSEEAVSASVEALTQLGDAPDALLTSRAVLDSEIIGTLWQLRAKCVGLLGRMDPSRQGTPFVEDAAVPAENLPDFVEGFREILDAEGLQYGMFGHADVGCVHVRPALDMRRRGDAAAIRRVSDKVNALAREHGGLLWGEHGKGFRGEYGPEFYGPRLYAAMCRIKAMFDPQGLLNPGKIAAPAPDVALTALDAVPFRGSMDASIAPDLSEFFDKAIKCNGNGQCMGRDFDDTMCPSYKATGDRTKGPKGRAVLLRQWARLQNRKTAPELVDVEAALFESLSDCLGCKACASQCPVQVDIPKMRSAFYARYYSENARPLAHHLLLWLERLGPVLRAVPAISNAVMALLAPIIRRIGLVDLPVVRPVASARLRAKLSSSAKQGGRDHVTLIADSFLGTFDGAVLDAAVELLDALGFSVALSPVINTGKPAHVVGASKSFAVSSRNALRNIRKLARPKGTIVALEPAFFAMFGNEYTENEYKEFGDLLPEVISLDQFLAQATYDVPPNTGQGAYTLLRHCSETAADPQTATRWRAIFERFGLSCDTPRIGCCGMAGTFGHETKKQDLSREVYGLSWEGKVKASQVPVLATGFSCRCQVARYGGERPKHPVEVLSDAVACARV